LTSNALIVDATSRGSFAWVSRESQRFHWANSSQQYHHVVFPYRSIGRSMRFRPGRHIAFM
jgi:hypothetical protein